MGLPVVPRTPANLSMSNATSGTRTETVTAGETAFVCVSISSTQTGGSGMSVSGAGGTWTEILNQVDGATSRRVAIWKGTGLSTGSQQVTLSFSVSTSCRWTWIPATGISSSTPDSSNSHLSTASSTRTSTDSSASGITTADNVLGIIVQAHSGAGISSITPPSGWTRVTGLSNTTAVIAYYASSVAFASEKGTVTYTSATTAAIGTIAAFNGDDQTVITTGKNLLLLGCG